MTTDRSRGDGETPRAVQQLKDYVQHKADCGAWSMPDGRGGEVVTGRFTDECTCGLSALLTAAGSRTSLFQSGAYQLHSGEASVWKIDCDALTDGDWFTFAHLIRSRVGAFSAVEGVPRGGLRLAQELQPLVAAHGPLLIVDDVLTTGASMEQQRAGRDAIGYVVFARGPVPSWVTPLFQFTAAGSSLNPTLGTAGNPIAAAGSSRDEKVRDMERCRYCSKWGPCPDHQAAAGSSAPPDFTAFNAGWIAALRSEETEDAPDGPHAAYGEWVKRGNAMSDGFHNRDHWFFARVSETGDVRIRKRATTGTSERPVQPEDEAIIAEIVIPENEWASIVASVSKGGETGESWQAVRDQHATSYAGSSAPPLDPPQESTLRRAVMVVLSRFRRDEEQGYRSKDRQFAIEILGKAVEGSSAPPHTPEETREEQPK